MAKAFDTHESSDALEFLTDGTPPGYIVAAVCSGTCT